jgi:hypothetical protein
MVELEKTSSSAETTGALNAQPQGDHERSISPRPSTDGGEDFWKKMDKHFEDILSESKKAFKVKTIINITLVILGVALIVNAIAYTIQKGTADGWSFFSGGIGMGALVSLFFYKSQDALSKAVANLSVVDMVFKSHYRAYESITDYDFKADHTLPHREITDLKEMLEALEKTTRAHVELIQQVQLIEAASQDTDANKTTKDAGAAST